MKTGKHDLLDKPHLTAGLAAAEERLGQLLCEAPIPVSELAENAGLFVSPRTVKLQFFINELYKLALPVHGVVLQFGVRWTRDLVQGIVLAFDELQSFVFPGETVAVRKVFGLDKIKLRRSPQYSGHGSYFVVE